MAEERRTSPMVNPTGGPDRRDPSANVLQLVGNVKDYLEDMHNITREYYDRKLADAVEASRRERAAETERINALRAVDIEAVKVANQMAIKQAEVLASQMAENAEALRASMAKTAETLAAQLQSVTQSLDNRLKIVEEKQYILAGSSKGSRDMWGWVSAGIMLIIAVISFVLMLTH